tara:strand:- start:49 stop:567 length:519 start_codon:yes stop_codon:yes gene_type:complete
MKKKIISIFLFFLICLPTYSSERVVYLDLEKIMQESIAGKSIIAQIKKKRESSISEFKKREKKIIENEKKLIAQKNILNKDEFEKNLKNLRENISTYQKDRNKAFNNITRNRVKASTNFIKKITPILEEYSKKNSIKIIVQKKHIVMGKKEDDITKDILELVNKNIKSIKVD